MHSSLLHMKITSEKKKQISLNKNIQTFVLVEPQTKAPSNIFSHPKERTLINEAEQRAEELTNPLTHSLYVHKVKTLNKERTISSINSVKKTGDYKQITKHLISHMKQNQLKIGYSLNIISKTTRRKESQCYMTTPVRTFREDFEMHKQ